MASDDTTDDENRPTSELFDDATAVADGADVSVAPDVPRGAAEETYVVTPVDFRETDGESELFDDATAVELEGPPDTSQPFTAVDVIGRE